MMWAASKRISIVLLVLLAFAGVFTALAPASAVWADKDEPITEHVIVLGSAGLLWSDIDRSTTPALAKLAEQGSIGALSVRAATSVTCPDAGWVTLGAGNRARGLSQGECVENVAISEPVPTGENYQLVQQADIVDRNTNLNHGARPGTLASSVRCTTAIGRAAAIAAAHQDGRVDNYYPSLPIDLRPVLAACPVTIIDIGDVTAQNRKQDLAALDRRVAAIQEAKPPSSVLVAAGISDLAAPPHLHVGIINGPGYARKWLVSPSTQREPYVQLIDIAPTIFQLLDVGTPSSVAGQPIRAGSARHVSLETAIGKLADTDAAAQAQRPLVQSLFASIVLGNLALMVTATIFFRVRHRRVLDADPEPGVRHDPRQVWSARSGRYARMLQVAAIALAALPVASLLANVVPWWRVGWSGGLHLATIVLFGSAIVVIAFRGPWRHHVLGPPGCVAVITALTLAGEVLTGSHLQMSSLPGYSPLVAGRFTGFGNIAAALFAASVLLSAAFIAQQIPSRRGRLWFLVPMTLVVIVIVGTPMWGNDFGGVVALTPALLVLILRSMGVWLSAARIMACVVFGFAVVGAFVVVDYLKPPEDRSHLGRFADQLLSGTATTIIQRKAEANFNLLVSSQLTFLVIAVAVFVPLVLLRRSAGLRRVFGLYPSVRAGAISIVVAAVVGFIVNDSGIAIPAFVAAVAVPLLIATTLRVLAEASSGLPSSKLSQTLISSIAEKPLANTVAQEQINAKPADYLDNSADSESMSADTELKRSVL